MTVGLATMTMVGMGVVGFVTSGVLWLALPAADRAAHRLAPRAASRLWRTLALTPLVAAVCVLVAVFALPPDHCVAHGAHHPHLCFVHAAAWPEIGLACIAAAQALYWAFFVARAGRHAWHSASVRRRLEAAAVKSDKWDPHVGCVPGERPWAVTVGLLRPHIYLTESMSLDADAQVVVEHEQLHQRDRHELWHWLVSLASALHLPGVGRALERRTVAAHEMAADEAGCAAVGDRTRVATALIRLARQLQGSPTNPPNAIGGLAFGASPLEYRVRSLLSDPRSGSLRQTAIVLGLVFATAACAVVLNARHVHHALEMLLGMVG